MPHSYRKEEQLLHNTQIKRNVLDLESGGTECHQKLDRNDLIPIEKRSNFSTIPKSSAMCLIWRAEAPSALMTAERSVNARGCRTRGSIAQLVSST